MDTHVWVPKELLKGSIETTKASLTFPGAGPQYVDTATHLGLPRAWVSPETLWPGVQIRYPKPPPRAHFTSKIKLDARDESSTHQRDAVRELGEGRSGVLEIGCGGGKTVIALHHIACTKAPALVIVPDSNVATQWQERAMEHLGLRREQIGTLDDICPLTITTYAMLARRIPKLTDAYKQRFGTVWYDEGHHVGAPTWAAAASFGHHQRVCLTATPLRADGMNVLIDLHIGPTLLRYQEQRVAPTITFVGTGARIDERQGRSVTGDRHAILQAEELGKSPEHMAAARHVIDRARRAGSRTLALTLSEDKACALVAMLCRVPLPSPVGRVRRLLDLDLPVGLLLGDTPEGLRAREREKRVLVTLHRFGREALDLKGLSVLLLLEAPSEQGDIAQMIGRVQRADPGITPEVYILADDTAQSRASIARIKRIFSTWPAEQRGPLSWSDE
jgi:hypothetical protein